MYSVQCSAAVSNYSFHLTEIKLPGQKRLHSCPNSHGEFLANVNEPGFVTQPNTFESIFKACFPIKSTDNFFVE